MPQILSDILVAGGWLALAVLVAGVLTWVLIRHLPHSRVLSGVLLRDATSRETGYLSAPDREDLVGTEGTALTDLRPSGSALIGDERVDVVTEGPWIESGSRVVVLRADGYRHLVRLAGTGESAGVGSAANPGVGSAANTSVASAANDSGPRERVTDDDPSTGVRGA